MTPAPLRTVVAEGLMWSIVGVVGPIMMVETFGSWTPAGAGSALQTAGVLLTVFGFVARDEKWSRKLRNLIGRVKTHEASMVVEVHSIGLDVQMYGVRPLPESDLTLETLAAWTKREHELIRDYVSDVDAKLRAKANKIRNEQRRFSRDVQTEMRRIDEQVREARTPERFEWAGILMTLTGLVVGEWPL